MTTGSQDDFRYFNRSIIHFKTTAVNINSSEQTFYPLSTLEFFDLSSKYLWTIQQKSLRFFWHGRRLSKFSFVHGLLQYLHFRRRFYPASLNMT